MNSTSSNPVMYSLAPVNYSHSHTVPWNFPAVAPYSPRLAGPATLQFPSETLHSPISINPLPIATHPMHWSRDDVVKWLRWSEEEFSLNGIDVSKFCMNGKGLLMLTKEDFKDRAAYAGDVLFEMLERLKRKEFFQPFPKYPPLSPISPARHDHDTSPGQPALPGCQLNPKQGNLQVDGRFDIATETFQERRIHEEGRLNSHQSIIVRHIQEPLPTPPNSNGRSRNGSLPSSDDDRHSPAVSCSDSDPNEAEMIDDKVQNDTSKEYNQATPLDLSTLSQPEKPNSDCRLLWEFLYFLLSEEGYSPYIKWEDRSCQIFRIIKPTVIAYLWGRQKNRKNMTYDKLSRALRYYYKMKILQKEEGQKLTYRFLKRPSELQPSPEYSKLQSKVSLQDGDETVPVKPEPHLVEDRDTL